MASVGDTQMQKQLRACRRRQRRYIRFKRGPKSSNQRSSFILKNFNAESGEVYIVESIRDEKIIKGQKYYKVRWRGFPPEADSWEPERNLTSVLNIISEFHSSKSKISKSLDMQKNYKAANSPASVPTPPATPNLLLQNLPNRLRGSSEERQLDNSAKRKHCAKSRTSGRYEYVPKHQLVASKTKYFDDIRDGKIDLCSNDLYSRVKTRRRCAAESASTSVSNESTQSQNGSLHGETELECDASMEHFPACSPKCEPVSPSSSCFGTSECFREFNCAFQSNEQMRSEFDVENPKHYDLDVTENVITSNASSSHVSDVISKFDSKAVQSEFNPNSSSKSVYCNFCRCSRLPKVDAGSSPIPHLSDNKPLQTAEKESNYSFVVTKQPENSHSIYDHSYGRSVSSLRTLVNIYFNLILSHISNEDQAVNDERPTDFHYELQSLPHLCLYNHLTCIQTSGEFLEAINNQRWSLVATMASNSLFPDSTKTQRSSQCLSTTEKSPESHRNGKQSDFEDLRFKEDALLACITGGAGRPLVLDQLLTSGLDPNKVIEPNSKWPLLALAVCLGRLHAAQALLDAGAKPNCVEPNSRQRSALGLAIAAGDVDMANMLILSGANFYEVEPGTTALNLITKLLNAHSSAQQNPRINYRQMSKSYLALIELQDKLRSTDSQFPPVPSPCPPFGVDVPSLPKSQIFNALLSSSLGNHCNSPRLNNVDCNISRSGNVLPSVDSLRRLHELVVAHHARLSVSVTNLVRTWLTRADLVQVGLVSPCQWISVRQCSTSLKFSWPNEVSNSKAQPSRVIAPLLILVHGRITPPACYDVWMDDDGPCVIEHVCLDQTYTQRALNRMLFVTTLYPLNWNASKPQEHEVLINFKSDNTAYNHSTRPTCVAIMIVAVAQSQTNDKERVSQQNGNFNIIQTSHLSNN
ncbi:Chromo domain protein [Schistosoma japonicum]|uniref:Chromo domain protein n=1 Tax=Schistosoma japonicum TaxID=6182 RepID=A0A4Z2DGN2_SCHJA|nr:Chromobox protein 5 [Schistosoma japonicum]TNN15390.1 Chromo domain protein [Schistosoma japonicum]